MAVPPDLAEPPDLRVDFEQIFNEHFSEIHRYIVRRLSDDVADDLAAEVFLAAYRGGYDASRGGVRPWLYGIATNLISRHRRTEIRRWKALIRTAERAEHNPEDVLGDSRLGELTLADLAVLPGDAGQLRTYWRNDQDGHSTFEEFLSSSSALLELPVSPAVRAAALRLLAGLPTTKMLGPITDPLGRAGIEVTFVKSEGFSAEFGAADEVAERFATILDPRTGTVLTDNAEIAAESTEGLAKGTFMNYQAWAPEDGWTGERPERPTGCRLSDRPLP